MFSVHYNVLFSSSVMLFWPFCSKPAPPSVLLCFVIIFELFLLHPWSNSVILQWEAVVRNYVLLSVDIFVFCLVGLLFLFGFILVLSGALGSKIRQWLSPHHVEVDLSPTQKQQCWELGTYDLFSVAWMSGDCRWGRGGDASVLYSGIFGNGPHGRAPSTYLGGVFHFCWRGRNSHWNWIVSPIL